MRSSYSKRPVVFFAAVLGSTTLSTASVAHAALYNPVGCFTDEGTRALPTQVTGAYGSEMTPALCSSLCTAISEPFFGLEAGEECFCGGDDYGVYGDSTNCTMACSGDSTQTCGGSWALSVYYEQMPSGFKGCFADSNTRDLPFLVSSGAPDMTVEQCRSSCYVLGYAYAGLESSAQCWCGDSYGSQGTSTSCSELCSGDAGEVCGGAWANDVWTSSAPGFVGCFADSATRDLPYTVTGQATNMTIEQCRSACYASGYTYAGVEDGNQCFCGDSYGSQGTATDCTSWCNGDTLEVCGGAGANAVWQAAAVPLLASTVAINSTHASTLALDSTLYAGNTVYSPSQALYLTMQTDGNLVLYFAPFGAATWSQWLWSSSTSGNPGARAVFQQDGNLVVYAAGGKALWAAGTNGKGAGSLAVQDDGNLVVYNSNNSALWAAGTNNLVPDSSHCTSNFCPAGTWWSSCDTPDYMYGEDGQGVYVLCDGHTAPLGNTEMVENYYDDPIPNMKCNNDWGTLDCSTP